MAASVALPAASSRTTAASSRNGTGFVSLATSVRTRWRRPSGRAFGPKRARRSTAYVSDSPRGAAGPPPWADPAAGSCGGEPSSAAGGGIEVGAGTGDDDERAAAALRAGAAHRAEQQSGETAVAARPDHEQVRAGRAVTQRLCRVAMEDRALDDDTPSPPTASTTAVSRRSLAAAAIFPLPPSTPTTMLSAIGHLRSASLPEPHRC